MGPLNFPVYQFRLKNSENKTYIFDLIRKKFVVLQPEEWVRQHVLHYLLYDKNYPKSLINVEKQLTFNGLKKRYDIVVFKSDGSIDILVECKAPSVQVTQNVFDQIAQYNLKLNANYLMVTNGLQNFYCEIDATHAKYTFLRQIPDYKREET